MHFEITVCFILSMHVSYPACRITSAKVSRLTMQRCNFFIYHKYAINKHPINLHVIIFSSLDALKFVKMMSFCVASDENFVKIASHVIPVSVNYVLNVLIYLNKGAVLNSIRWESFQGYHIQQIYGVAVWHRQHFFFQIFHQPLGISFNKNSHQSPH